MAALSLDGLASAVAADGQDDPTATALALVFAYCTRGIPDPPPPMVVKIVRVSAVRLAANPSAIKSVSAEGQSVSLPTLGFTYLESTLLNPYRRRTA